MVKITKIDAVSLGKVLGILYALMGLITGGIFSLFALIGFGTSAIIGAKMPYLIPLFGLGAIVFFPIFYGAAGFVMGIITALPYNLVSSWVGGLEVETEK